MPEKKEPDMTGTSGIEQGYTGQGDGQSLSAPGFKSTLLEAALVYAAQGWPVFPVGKDKRPLTSHGFKDASIDQDVIRGLFAGGGVAGIGVPTGPASGLFVIDRDRKGGKDGILECQKLEEELGPLPATLRQQTGSGGDQLFFQWPDGVPLKNSAGKLGPGIDTRGEGGYVVVPPSVNTAGPYTWLNDLPLAPLPQAWIERLADSPKPKQDRKPYASMLLATPSTPHGLAALDEECQAVASETQGSRNARLNQAAFACGQLVAGGKLVEDEARARLEHAASACGLGEVEAAKTIESGLVAGMKEPRQPFTVANDAKITLEKALSGEWPEFFDFDELPPALPEHLLPGVLGRFVEGLALATQTPRELAAINALGVLALAVQGKIIVRVKPDYVEPLNIYALVASEPGERKSAVVSACKAPVIEWETEQYEAAIPAISAAISKRKTLEKAIERDRGKAAGAKTAADRAQAAQDIFQRECELPVIPPTPRLLVDDVTPEALAVVMTGTGSESVGMLEAEGGVLETFAGRYSNSVANIDLMLKAFSGEPVTVDRMGRDPLRLKRPLLTMILTPQPSVLWKAGRNEEFIARGLIARFILILPQSLVGFRDNTKTIPLELTGAWDNFVRELLAVAVPAQPHEIPLSQEAFAQWVEFSRDVEEGQRPDGEFEFLRPWASKLTGLVVRLAGLFHMVKGVPAIGQPIPGETMRRATVFATWVAEHAKAVYLGFGRDNGFEAAARILAQLRKTRAARATARELYQPLRGRFPTMDKIKPGLAMLVDRGALVPVDVGPGAKGGRPSENYLVNPSVHGTPYAQR